MDEVLQKLNDLAEELQKAKQQAEEAKAAQAQLRPSFTPLPNQDSLPPDVWRSQYNEYMSSRQWEEKRQAILFRDSYICQDCHQRDAEEVHHLSYQNFFHEKPFELVSLCKSCHRKRTDHKKFWNRKTGKPNEGHQ